jgi:hypothetical protein
LPHSVIDDDNPSYLWTGSALLAYNSTAYTTGGPDGTRLPGGNAAWDPTSNTWTSLPAAPLAGSGDIAAVWTGSQLLEWGPMMDPTTLAGGGSPAVHDAGLSFAP